MTVHEYAQMNGTQIAARRRSEVSWAQKIKYFLVRWHEDRKYRLYPAPETSKSRLARMMLSDLRSAKVTEITEN